MNAMELKPCKCGSTDIKLDFVIWEKIGKSSYRYQCKKCGRAACVWACNEDIAVEIWNDTMRAGK